MGRHNPQVSKPYHSDSQIGLKPFTVYRFFFFSMILHVGIRFVKLWLYVTNFRQPDSPEIRINEWSEQSPAGGGYLIKMKNIRTAAWVVLYILTVWAGSVFSSCNTARRGEMKTKQMQWKLRNTYSFVFLDTSGHVAHEDRPSPDSFCSGAFPEMTFEHPFLPSVQANTQFGTNHLLGHFADPLHGNVPLNSTGEGTTRKR